MKNPFLDEKFQIEPKIPIFEQEFRGIYSSLSSELFLEYFSLFHPEIRCFHIKTATKLSRVTVFNGTPKMFKLALQYVHSNYAIREKIEIERDVKNGNF